MSRMLVLPIYNSWSDSVDITQYLQRHIINMLGIEHDVWLSLKRPEIINRIIDIITDDEDDNIYNIRMIMGNWRRNL